MRLPIVYIALALIGCFASACTSPKGYAEKRQELPAEEMMITSGTLISTVEEILTKYSFEYGNQFGLQWIPPEGQSILFCRLDKDATLAVTFDIKTKKVLYLSVDCTAIRSKVDAAILRPISISFTPKGYLLTFRKNERG